MPAEGKERGDLDSEITDGKWLRCFILSLFLCCSTV